MNTLSRLASSFGIALLLGLLSLRAHAETVAKLKSQPVDMIINNAALKRTGPITDPNANKDQKLGTLDYKRFDEFMHTNVTARCTSRKPMSPSRAS